jgi:hypothetical protein
MIEGARRAMIRCEPQAVRGDQAMEMASDAGAFASADRRRALEIVSASFADFLPVARHARRDGRSRGHEMPSTARWPHIVLPDDARLKP